MTTLAVAPAVTWREVTAADFTAVTIARPNSFFRVVDHTNPSYITITYRSKATSTDVAKITIPNHGATRYYLPV